MPDLAQQIKVGLCCLEPGAEPPQKAVGDLVAHVEADAVDVVPLHPALAQGDEVFLHFGVVGVQLGHPAVEGEGEVLAVPGLALVKGPPADKEPVPVGGGGPAGRHVPPGGKMGAAVVEDRVQHDPDALRVGGADQLFEVGLAAEVGVHPGVVGGVVLVDAARGKDGVEVKAVHPQLGQVGQFGGDAGQVPAEAFGVGNRPLPPGLPARPPAASAAEPVGEDLIPDRLPHPVGRGDQVGGVHPRHGETLDFIVQL